jgi:hypothetical protein
MSSYCATVGTAFIATHKAANVRAFKSAVILPHYGTYQPHFATDWYANVPDR